MGSKSNIVYTDVTSSNDFLDDWMSNFGWRRWLVVGSCSMGRMLWTRQECARPFEWGENFDSYFACVGWCLMRQRNNVYYIGFRIELLQTNVFITLWQLTPKPAGSLMYYSVTFCRTESFLAPKNPLRDIFANHVYILCITHPQQPNTHILPSVKRRVRPRFLHCNTIHTLLYMIYNQICTYIIYRYTTLHLNRTNDILKVFVCLGYLKSNQFFVVDNFMSLEQSRFLGNVQIKSISVFKLYLVVYTK